MAAMSEAISWVGLVGAGILLICGVVDLVVTWSTKSKIRQVTDSVAEGASQVAPNTGGLQPQSVADVTDSVDAIAKLAAALKDLDRTSRLFVLSLTFLAVAAAATGLNDIAQAL